MGTGILEPGLAPLLGLLVGLLLGLVVGSFLNVVIYRLPLMLERQWEAECAERAGQEPVAAEAFNLLRPASRCRACATPVRWYHNVPVLGFLALRGRCANCATPIGWRYPVVELVTGALFAYCLWRWGLTPVGLLWCGFSALLLTMALIDWDTTLLPDNLTLPLLWAGLIAAALGWTGPSLSDAVWGAVAGYLSLWSVYWAFKLLTGKEGMGYGDFKLLAALGAWFGWQALLPIILLSSVIGAVVGLAMKFSQGLREGGYIPFGPFLAGAGFVAMVVGTRALRLSLGL